MAITDAQKVDYLYKKIGAGVAKTDTSAYKSPSNEANASPILTRGDTIWQQSVSIPTVKPASNSSVVVLYQDSLTSTIECTLDTTVSGTNRTWLTNLSDWVGPEFGATYQVKVYAAATGVANAQTSGTQLFSDGSGNSDSWFFDYQAGILNFPDTNVPTALSGKKIYIVGARYAGAKGLTVFPVGTTFGNLTLDGNIISSSSGNVTIASNLYIVGNTTISGYSDIAIQDSILNLHTQANLAPWSFNDGKDIGIKMHYYDYEDSHAALVRANDTGYLEWYSRGREITGNVFSGNAYGVIKTGELILANATPATGSNTGALIVYGGASISGNLYVAGLEVDSTVTTSLSVDLLTANSVVTNIATIGNLAFSDTTVTHSNVFVFNSNTAIQVPVGDTSERPAGVNGYLRYNTDIPALEYYDGSIWVPVTNTVTDQTITGDGSSDTFALDQEATSVGTIVSINGTLQQPVTSYNISGNQITFNEIPEATDIIDVRFLGAAVTINATLSDDLQVSGNITATENITLGGILTAPQTTKASSDAGSPGEICWDNNYIYVCTAPNTWKRTPLTGGY